MARDRLKPLASRPAHCRRMGMDAFTPPIFPDTGVRLEGESSSLFAEWLDHVKQRRVARARQPPVEEHRCRREDDAAINIVLALLAGRVSNPCRTVAAIPGKSRCRSLLEQIRMHDAIKRAHRFAAPTRDA